ncbi:MAG: hypothetical protein GX879_00740, partial [Bacteroidales bacterium]|nr:hypothetical protein [Bacteroidales bacterium]
NSPLLKDNDIRGAKNILLNIMSSTGEHEIGMREFGLITSHLTEIVGSSTNIIWGTGFDNSLEEKIRVTIIATGFPAHEEFYELVQNYVHVPFGEEIPVPQKTENKELKIEDENPTENEGIFVSYPEDDNEQAKIVEFTIESESFDEPELEELSEVDLERINTDSNKFDHLKDLEKLNDSAYLDEIEQKPAYLRQNENLRLDFDDEN